MSTIPPQETVPAKGRYGLRPDPDAPDLYLMGPYDYGADQLRVNGYSFPGKPEAVLVQAVAAQLPEAVLVSHEFGLALPTFYFVENVRFPRWVASFIGESSEDPMVALFQNKLLEELIQRGSRTFLGFLRGVLVHELAHAYAEKELGDGLLVEEEAVLAFERQYLLATNLDHLKTTLNDWRKLVDSFK